MINFDLFDARLESYAVKNGESQGRMHKEKINDDRLPFQRDRDRIIHCRAFRRLDEKTQVVVADTGDHFRTRLTHTLEVAQVARDLARSLRLNEDLCEAIALAHDLGHPPFGHAGEHALDELMKNFGKHFEHNEQSRRVVEHLEKPYPGFEGLNLTKETLEGMMKHQTAFDQQGKIFEKSAHMEAQVVNLADEIAYTNHDIDDGLRFGVITVAQLEKIPLWQRSMAAVEKEYGKDLAPKVAISRVISGVMSLMIEDVIMQTGVNVIGNKISSLEDVKNFQGVLVNFSDEMRGLINELRAFLFDHFYMHPDVLKAVDKGMMMIKRLFSYYHQHPGQLPKDWDRSEEGIKDYIAGMTDLYIEQEYHKAFPKEADAL